MFNLNTVLWEKIIKPPTTPVPSRVTDLLGLLRKTKYFFSYKHNIVMVLK